MMRVNGTVIVAVLVIGCASRGTLVMDAGGALRITGTFTDLRYQEAVGVVGAEVRVSGSDKPAYQAVVQFGLGNFCAPEEAGTPACARVSNLILVPVVFDETSVTSDKVGIHLLLSGEFAGVFEGDITKQHLSGVFTFTSGKQLRVELPRGPSHWDADEPDRRGRRTRG